MARSAMTAPCHVVPQRNATGQANSQPDSAPSLEYGGGGLLDARLPWNKYNYPNAGSAIAGAQVIGWFGSGEVLCVDQAPSTAATNNIAAAANVTSGTAMTLVSSSGAGITVLATATTALPSLNTIPANTLAIDSAFNYVKFGRRDITAFYDPTKAIARCLSITSASSATGGAFKVVGYDLYGYPQTETITAVAFSTNPTTVGKKAWKYIVSVTPQFTDAHNYSVGTSDVFGYPLRADNWGYVYPIWNGNGVIGGGAGTSVITIPISANTDLANSQTYQILPGFNGKLTGANYRVGKAVTTGSKLATIQLQVNATSLTGGVISLTSAGMTPTGTAIAATAITAGTQTFTSTQTIGFTVSAVTAFTEGDGWIELLVTNTDSSGVNHISADTTSPATATTGDVRGTFSLPGATINSGGNGTLTAVSNGTAKLQLFVSTTVAGASNATSQNVGFYGVTPA